MEKVGILVICTGNACRSQMAEGLIRSEFGDRVDAQSAGVSPASRVHPYAVEIMKEAGISIAGAKPKHMDTFAGREFDIVITVCDHAKATCPVIPGAPVTLHWSLPDPGSTLGCAAEIKEAFRDTLYRLQRRMPELESIVNEIAAKKNSTS